MPRINDYLQGFQDGLPGMKDYQHASRLYIDDNYKLMPKQKFLFHVVFNTDENLMINGFSPNEKLQLNMLVKQCDLPKYNLSYEEKVQYNKKMYAATRIAYEPVNITWDNGMNGGFLNGLCSGDYNYTATDAQGCELTGTVTVTGTVEGCTDLTACNYQAVADIDDGSCVYLDDLNVTLNTNESGHTVLTWDALENVSIYKVYKGTSLDNMSFIGSSNEPYFLTEHLSGIKKAISMNN